MTSAGRQGSRPDRRIWALVGVAALTTIAVLVFVAVSRGILPGGASSPNIARGQPVPNIQGTTLDGSTIDLAALRGHPVLINFWGPSCVPCREEMPLLAQKATEHQGSGLVILGVLTDDPVQPAKAFADQYGGTWPTVVDPGSAIKQAYHVVGRPQSFFVDREGILRSIAIGPLMDADFERQFALISGGAASPSGSGG